MEKSENYLPKLPESKLWVENEYNRDKPLWKYIGMINEDLQDAFECGLKAGMALE